MIEGRFLVLILLFRTCLAGDIGNSVVAASCECDKDAINVKFITEKPFAGRIYARGFPDDPRCSKSISDLLDTHITISIPSSQCNVQSTPTESSIVMLINFHGIFLTTMDRQYRCMCKYDKGKPGENRGGPQMQTNHLEVSMLPTTEIMDTGAGPSCDYSIHSNAADGPAVSHAKVGDRIWHTWKCSDASVGVFVRNCMATNADGREVELLDEHGCAIDNTILPDLQYSQDLSQASVETWAFRFSDSSLLNFMCMIETCRKSGGECTGLTPPVCGRGKRSVQNIFGNKQGYNDDSNVYQIGNTMNIMSLDDEDDSYYFSKLNQRTSNTSHRDFGNVCLGSEPLISIGLISLLFLVVTAFSTVKLLQLKMF